MRHIDCIILEDKASVEVATEKLKALYPYAEIEVWETLRGAVMYCDISVQDEPVIVVSAYDTRAPIMLRTDSPFEDDDEPQQA